MKAIVCLLLLVVIDVQGAIPLPSGYETIPGDDRPPLIITSGGGASENPTIVPSDKSERPTTARAMTRTVRIKVKSTDREDDRTPGHSRDASRPGPRSHCRLSPHPIMIQRDECDPLPYPTKKCFGACESSSKPVFPVRRRHSDSTRDYFQVDCKCCQAVVVKNEYVSLSCRDESDRPFTKTVMVQTATECKCEPCGA